MLFILVFHPSESSAEEDKEIDVNKEKLALYKKNEAVTNIPWFYLAAIDKYEKNIKKDADSENLISIAIPEIKWFGIGNPSKNTTASWISAFEGWGKDGNGDGKADPNNDEDILYSMASYIEQQGTSREDIKIALWKYYQRELTVQTIANIAKVYQTFNTIVLEDNDFPLPLNMNYSYRNTWGDARGFGGRRIHEGTDIFANYGVPVKSTTYGVVEMKGWNRFGGWRIGIRDIKSRYHYYAHLNGYKEGIKVGDVVKPGDIIGSVGATGYGPPGTSGKFPPHLHYGMYKDNGYSEWSFDPYPYLSRWEREARNKK
ncbi:peptidoglycan DD-metalloendopeptidase family protein [Aquibacillus halophilus]|uniref:Peptidoglycan DD-metalloendopeptidase family protein n=1 Tax=Aquibacillus halophilus TaxID=930132 RepID=A0A6A8DNT6_9BACI|nr:M23 family metallopeptidase [Aquibacillus halophilus]MRH44717.1 peptidoglycan DD-metalloendopeptidase family protein [Aquibacillus halophilus]